jgi:hypothetical protein
MAIIASDDFNRADTDNLGSNWTTVPGGGNGVLFLRSNTAEATGDPDAMYYNAVAAPNDCEVGVTMRTPVTTAADNGIGPAGRCSTIANTMYFVMGNVPGIDLYVVVADNYVKLGNSSTACVDGDKVSLRMVGTSIKVFQNGVERISVTDGSIASGRAGMFGAVEEVQPRCDDWYLDDLTGGTPVAGYYHQSQSCWIADP